MQPAVRPIALAEVKLEVGREPLVELFEPLPHRGVVLRVLLVHAVVHPP